MLADRLAGHVHLRAQLAQGLAVACVQAVQQPAAARVGERPEHVVHARSNRQPSGCMIIGSQSAACQSPCAGLSSVAAVERDRGPGRRGAAAALVDGAGTGRRDPPPGAVGARGGRLAPGPDRGRSIRASTRSSACGPRRRWPRPRPRTAAPAAGEPLGPLHGLPIAIKDLEDTAGIRTTYGSVAFAEHVPAADSLAGGAPARGRGDRGRARPTPLSSGSARTRSTRCSAPPATRGRWIARPAGAAAGRARRSPRACCPSPTAPTTAAASATRPRSTTWSGCGRRRGWCPTAVPATSGTRPRWSGRWRGRSAIWR